MIKGTHLTDCLYQEDWTGVVTMRELQESAEERCQWHKLDGSINPYVVIINIAQLAAIPPLIAIKNNTEKHPKNLVNFIVSGDNPIHSHTAAFVGKMTGYKFHQTNSVEEAVILANEILQTATRRRK